MNSLDCIQQASALCEALRGQLAADSRLLAEFYRRLEQISAQIHKNMEVRDVTFAQEFNDFCQTLRQDTDKQEEAWAQVRAQVRSWTKDDYGADMALPAKGFNNKAKTLSRMCDEFSTEYHRFYRLYQGYTAQKLNVWLLTSCASTINNITDKVLFLAREIAQKAERYRR